MSSSPVIDTDRRFGGLARLYGPQGVDRLRDAHVAVAGIGGVGSWCVEALARSGVGALTLIDLDHIAESNINRQLHALTDTLGQAKTHAMAQRVAQINPHCRLTAIEDFVEPDNVRNLVDASVHVLVDCTDQMAAKVAMVRLAAARHMSVVVCGGAGGKTDPLMLRAGDLARACNDALLSRLRNVLRREYGYPRAADASGKALKRVPAMGVRCLWVDQPALLPQAWVASSSAGQAAGGADAAGSMTPDAAAVTADGALQAPQGLSCAGYGSAVTVTASMGLAAANEAIQAVLAAGRAPAR